MSEASPSGGKVRSELFLRVVSAIVLLIIFLPVVWIGGLAFTLLCCALALVLFYEWGMIVGRKSSGWLAFGAAYCGSVALTLPFIRNHDGAAGLVWLLLVFIIVWATDIAAYFAGRRFGGPKLMPKVSPKKTWSGAIGGAVAAVVLGGLFGWYFPVLPMMAVLGLALVLSVFSQAGDLFESWIKRRFAVKDSSNLIPGHGGFLDRMDGLIAASIPLAVYLLLR